MAESTLSLDFDGLADAISFYLWGQPDYDSLSAANKAIVGTLLQDGYRQFLYPPSIGDIPDGYEWTFMFPWTTIDTVAAYDTGTVGVSSGTCTLTGGTWPSWAYTNGILSIDSTEYTISSRNSDTELTVSGDDVTAGEDDWTLEHNGNQTLPDDFGRLIDGFYHERDESKAPVLADVGVDKIRALRAQDNSTGEMEVAAIKISAIGAGATGQRREVMWWPRPNAAYTMHYRYEAFVGALADSTYPVGAMKHVETLKSSCLAAAEVYLNDEHGVHWDMFIRNLKGSVKRDMNEQPKFYGQVGALANKKARDTLSYTLTVNGTVIES